MCLDSLSSLDPHTSHSSRGARDAAVADDAAKALTTDPAVDAALKAGLREEAHRILTHTASTISRLLSDN